MIAAFFGRYGTLLEILAGIALLGYLSYEGHRFIAYEQGIGYGRAQLEYTQKENEALKAAAAKTALLQQQIDEANRHAAEREETIRKLSAATAVSAGGLRDTINAIAGRVPAASLDALRQSVTVLGSTLRDCTSKYADMAGNAAEAAADRDALIEAWPKP